MWIEQISVVDDIGGLVGGSRVSSWLRYVTHLKVVGIILKPRPKVPRTSPAFSDDAMTYKLPSAGNDFLATDPMCKYLRKYPAPKQINTLRFRRLVAAESFSAFKRMAISQQPLTICGARGLTKATMVVLPPPWFY
jgi:hypothetical protein